MSGLTYMFFCGIIELIFLGQLKMNKKGYVINLKLFNYSVLLISIKFTKISINNVKFLKYLSTAILFFN
jgi:hypothetical protein